MKIIIIILCTVAIFSAKSYLFSVIISLYNTERYLDDSIGSIINQTIGFNNIQLILINDGSTDNSEKLCLKYKNIYTSNIVYVKIEHSGVSKARNIGLKYAKGLFINFLDSDDKWDIKAFEHVYLYFKLFKNLQLIGCRIKYFESSDKYHFLDYKFKKTKIANLNEEYNLIHLSASSSFFRSSSLKGLQFIEGLLFGEDSRFIITILLNNPIIGFIREAVYYYRKRLDSSSAIQNSEQSYKFYFYTIEYVEQYIINESIKLYNSILPFIQFYLAYDLLFRIKASAYKYLDSNNFLRYCKRIENLLRLIEDKYFLEQNIFSSKLIIFALSKKYDSDQRYKITFQNNSFLYSNKEIINLNIYKSIIYWNIVEMQQNNLHIEGEDRFWMPKKDFYYYCQLENKKFFPEYYYYSGNDFTTIYGTMNKGRIISFNIKLKMKEEQTLHFYLVFRNKNIELSTTYGESTHIPPIENAYYIIKNYILVNNNNTITIKKFSNNLQISLESKYTKSLIKIKKGYLVKTRNKIINIRNTQKDNKKNQIWLINDRKNQAGDNGEYFFRYLNSKNINAIQFYFIIRKNCSDYERLKIFDNIIDLDSKEYLELFYNADKIISSVAESWVINPYGEDGKYICDFYNFQYIYLNNGVIKDDISLYINKIKTNFDLIITSSYKEYKSLLNKNYGFKKRNIILTGLPRFDNLKNLEKKVNTDKIILIFPTWRMYIKGMRDLINHESIQSKSFINTNYFNFYNDLINDQLLLRKMKENNYRGILCLHPIFKEQWIFFEKNNIFDIKKNCFEQELIVKSSLLITDYSSLSFDFGYIQKPLIYTQFDYKEYRQNHFKEGYFDYKRDGFGPICYDMQCTIKTIISQIENECKINKLYLMRIKRFFEYSDENNNYRIYQEIIKEKNNISYLSNSIPLFILSLLIIKKIINQESYTINK